MYRKESRDDDDCSDGYIDDNDDVDWFAGGTSTVAVVAYFRYSSWGNMHKIIEDEAPGKQWIFPDIPNDFLYFPGASSSVVLCMVA